MADDNSVTISHPHYGEREIDKSAIPFFINGGWNVLKSDGSVNPKPVSPVNNSDKKD